MTHFVSIRFLFPIALLAVATAATAGPSTDEAFENLADEYISDLVNFSPVQATLVGDHSADDRLDDVDAASRAQSRELLREYIEALQEFDLDQLTRANNEMYDVAKQQLQQAIDFVIERNIVTVPDLPCRNNHHAGLHQKTDIATDRFVSSG